MGGDFYCVEGSFLFDQIGEYMLNVYCGIGGVFSWNDFIQQIVIDGFYYCVGFVEQFCLLCQQLSGGGFFVGVGDVYQMQLL